MVWRTKYANTKNVGLGAATQFEESKMELEEYRAKNRELNKTVLKLQEENEKLNMERDRARISA